MFFGPCKGFALVGFTEVVPTTFEEYALPG
jgi:hypothetical protein